MRQRWPRGSATLRARCGLRTRRWGPAARLLRVADCPGTRSVRGRSVDGWLVAAFEVVASVLCISRAFGSRRPRAFPLLLGLGVLSWSIGDTLLTFESAGGATPSVPSFADLFWLGFYPLVYVALVLLMRRHVSRLRPQPGSTVRSPGSALRECAPLRLQHDPALRRWRCLRRDRGDRPGLSDRRRAAPRARRRWHRHHSRHGRIRSG